MTSFIFGILIGAAVGVFLYAALTKSDGWGGTNNTPINGSCQIGVTF